MVWTAIDTPLEPREYALPEVEDDAMLVKIAMACICGSDLHSYKGEYVGHLKPSKEKPLIMGREVPDTIRPMSSKLSSANRYLRDPAVRERTVLKSVATSSAIEGIRAPFKRDGRNGAFSLRIAPSSKKR